MIAALFTLTLLPVLLSVLIWSRTRAWLRALSPDADFSVGRWAVPVATLSGGACGMLFAIMGRRLHALLPDSEVQDTLSSLLLPIAVDAGMEELGKVFLLFMLLLMGVLRGRLLALLLGLVAGAAFACVENMAYLLVALGEDSASNWRELLAVRLPVSTFLHPAMSALTAMGFAMLVHPRRPDPRWTESPTTPAWRGMLGGIALILTALLLHTAWNGSLAASDIFDLGAITFVALFIPLAGVLLFGRAITQLCRQIRAHRSSR